MSHAPNLLASSPHSEVVLGICLNARQVGTAVLTAEHLLDYGVTTLCRIDSREGKDNRFRQVVEKLLDRHGVTTIALTRMASKADPDLLAALRAWLAQEAEKRGITLCDCDETTAETRVVTPVKHRATHRNVAEDLARQYAELSRLAPSSRPAPGADRVPELATRPHKVWTNRDKYWSRMFLALAAASHVLTEILERSVDRDTDS